MFKGLLKLVLLVGLPALIAYRIHNLSTPLPPPKLEETWWGPGNAGKEDTTIRPFKINVSDAVLTDLKHRLEKARPFTAPLENSKHHYGFNTDLLREIVEFWKSQYNWRQREARLNRFPQYIAQIQGLDIHYLHVKPQNPKNLKIVPLLICHGWPGSFKEFDQLIPTLTQEKGQDFVFEVVIPSLPGFGFSQSAAKQGLGPAQMAVIFKNLMDRLGFKKYYAQGGDWGSAIVSAMGALYPNHVLGLHLNLCMTMSPISNLKYALGALYPPLVVEKKHQAKMYPAFGSRFYRMLLETGYFHIQATKPDTVGVGLNDSPVGLAAYILEKFISATNMEYKDLQDGGLKYKFKYEDLLDNVMIYWITNSATSSMRIYAEFANIAYSKLQMDRVPVTVPTACLQLTHEISYQPEYILKDKYVNLVQITDEYDGGHFAAMEVPEILSKDIWSAVAKMEKLKTV